MGISSLEVGFGLSVVCLLGFCRIRNWKYRLDLPNGQVEFIPFAEVEKKSGDTIIAVDCSHPVISSITHHRSKSKVRGIQGDSSTELVLNARLGKHPVLQDKRLVTCNHFDIDGFLAVQALRLDQATILRRRNVFIQAARIGDFRELNFEVLSDENHPQHSVIDQALKICCLLNTLERKTFARPFETEDHDKWEVFLSHKDVKLALEDGDFSGSEDLWRDEYERVVQDCQVLRDSLQTKVKYYNDIDLVVIQTDTPKHYYALFSLAKSCDTVLSCYSNGRFEIEQRYSTYVELTSRPVFPRICLTKFAKLLRQAQPNERWTANRYVDSGPMLRIDPSKPSLTKAERYGHPFERPIYPSKIPQPVFEQGLVEFLRFGLSGIQREFATCWPFSRMHEHNNQLAGFSSEIIKCV